MKSFLWGSPQFLYLASSTNCRLQVDLPQPAEARNDAERRVTCQGRVSEVGRSFLGFGWLVEGCWPSREMVRLSELETDRMK